MFNFITFNKKTKGPQLESITNMCGESVQIRVEQGPWQELKGGSKYLRKSPEIPVQIPGQKGGNYLRLQIKLANSSLVTERYLWAEPTVAGFVYFQSSNRHGEGKKKLSQAGIQKGMDGHNLFVWPDPNYQNLAVLGNSLNHQPGIHNTLPLVEKWNTLGKTA